MYLGADVGGKDGGRGEDVFVGGEEALRRTHNEGEDWGGEGTEWRGRKLVSF